MKATPSSPTNVAIPRLGFLGVGWIGFQRMDAIARSGYGQVAAVCDTSPEAVARALQAFPGAAAMPWEAMLEAGLDGVVIATPSARHFAQATAALERGIPVFCQKPLGRTGAEVRAMVESARAAGVLLGVDLSYRFTQAMRRMREVVARGEIGNVYAANLVFHNAYGPDKPWFYDLALAGGGCVIDLGIHLVDLAFWMLDSPLRGVSSRLYRQGRPLAGRTQVEDYATARLDFASGACAQIACSWNLHAGRDAMIEAAFYGERGGVVMRNHNGSFLDFTAEKCTGTTREILAGPPDAWGGRAAVDWARRVAEGAAFDPDIARAAEVAEALDRIYAAC